MNKQQRAYAESIEDRIEKLEILINIRFLKDKNYLFKHLLILHVNESYTLWLLALCLVL